MQQNLNVDVLREKILIHTTAIEGAVGCLSENGDQHVAAGLLYSFWELRDALNDTVKEVTGNDLY